MTLGKRIQNRRAVLGLSQEKLAELVGVSRQAVSKWEVGDALPDTDKLVPLARALGISVDELLGNTPDATEKPCPEAPRPGSGEPVKEPGWFALHWYWLGLIPVVWGVFQLLWLLVAVLSFAGMTAGNTIAGASEVIASIDVLN